MTSITMTRFRNADGPLTKLIRLDHSGGLRSDSSGCIMSRGTAERIQIPGVEHLSQLIHSLDSDEAIALGSLRAGLPHKVGIVTRRAINGASQPGLIARSAENIVFKSGHPGFALLDFDTKGMPADVAERLAQAGGFWPALLSVMPILVGAARIMRASTSAGLFRQDTGQPVPGSNGVHVYLAVEDAADSRRFLKALHDRCWLGGLGWLMVGAGGQLLERSIVDRMVGSPERLVFEGPPILAAPLIQNAAARRPMVTQGDPLDTALQCPPLTVEEKARLDLLHARAKQQLAGESAKAREEFIDRQADELAKQGGVSRRKAVETVRKQCQGVLLPSVVLPFDDPDLAGKTIADVLADPAEFEGETLADPLEGVEYGRCKARIMRRADGTPWIHSFAHGRTVYELKFDAAAIRAAMAAADAREVVAVLIDMLLRASVEAADEEALIAYAKERSGTGIRSIQRELKEARQAKTEERAKVERERRLAKRDDPRPMLRAPAADAPFLPVMDTINAILGKSGGRIPPARTIAGEAACVRQLPVAGTHAFVSANENSDIAVEAPPHWTIHAMSGGEVAELIERHIDYVDDEDRSVHLAALFVAHYRRRDDGALPIMSAVATLPLVSADAHLIRADGLDRQRGIVFKVEKALMKIMPRREECDPQTVGDAMRFLLDEWLADVASDFAGKCSLIGLALTILERSLLDQRPAWFVTAGRRGSGKTTTLQMVLLAVTGGTVSAAAWSPNEEERRKALHSYLMSGVPYVLWDNISRGTQISCPHIERSCTATYYDDRKLGVSETVRTAAATVHCFTGNNIAPKGDLASRSVQVRLDVDRVDPENRAFKHPDPIAWTRAHRSEILRAIYIILLGNPTLDLPRDASMKTRFKLWYRLVGSAVEHAAQCEAETDPNRGEIPDQVLDVGALFLDQEAGDEDETSLAEALDALDKAMNDRAARLAQRRGPFKASDVADLLNTTADPNALIVRSFLFPNLQAGPPVNAKAVGKRLNDHVREPVRFDGRTLVLNSMMDKHARAYRYCVTVTSDDAGA